MGFGDKKNILFAVNNTEKSLAIIVNHMYHLTSFFELLKFIQIAVQDK